MRGLLAVDRPPPARIQDPYGYRAFPQVHGPALDAAAHAEEVVTREINAAAENPLVDVAGRTVWHNGNFHTAYVGLALDAVRAALFQTAALSAARLGTLVEPAFTGLRAVPGHRPAAELGDHDPGVRGALGHRRHPAAGRPGGAGQRRAVAGRRGARRASPPSRPGPPPTSSAAYRIVLACELVAAVRALRLQGRAPAGGPLRRGVRPGRRACSTRASRTGRWTPTSPPPRTCCPASPGCIPTSVPPGPHASGPAVDARTRRDGSRTTRRLRGLPSMTSTTSRTAEWTMPSMSQSTRGQRRGEQRRHRMVVVPADGHVAGDVEARARGWRRRRRRRSSRRSRTPRWAAPDRAAPHGDLGGARRGPAARRRRRPAGRGARPRR